ncbi:MAG TPA: ABC transporter permease [candidate division Zixibacteria bacterium]|nr:ABC transporter permease [candidate division Zixibacteria bacterium]
MSFITRVSEKINLFFRMIFINKKYTLVAFIGLGVSLSLVTTSLIFLYSYQYDAFNKYVIDHPEEQITVAPANMLSSYGIEDTIIPDLDALIDQSLTSADLEGRISFRGWFNHRSIVVPYQDRTHNNSTELLPLSYAGVPAAYFDILEPFILDDGRLPSKNNEALCLLQPGRFESTNFSIGNQNLYVTYDPFNIWAGVIQGIPEAGAQVNITGVINTYELQNAFNSTSYERTLLNNLFSVFGTDELIISFHKNIMHFTENIGTIFPSLMAPNRQIYVGTILFNLNEIDAFHMNDEITKIISFSENIRSQIEIGDLSDDVHIYMDILDILQNFVFEFEIFRLLTILFMIPIISMALSLTIYSANLVKRRRKRQLSLLSQRGSSRSEIITLLSIEMIIFTVIAIVLSFLIAYPYSFLILKSDNFLSFHGPTIIPRLFTFILQIIIGSGFAGSLIVNVGSIWNLSKLTQEEAFSERKEKKPFWERFYIDIFLLIVGITAWIITSIQLKKVTVSIAFARILGIPAPIIVILGTILFVTRIYPTLTRWLSNVRLKTPRIEILKLSLKSLSRRRSATMRSLVLVTFTFTMAVASIIIPDTYQNFDYETASYDLGADIVISGVSKSDVYFRETIEAIEGIKGTTYVARLNYEPITRGSVTYYYTFLGINTSEYSNIAFTDNEYIDEKQLAETTALLNKPLDSGMTANVLAQKDQIVPYNLTKDETFKVYYSYWAGSSNLERNYTVRSVGFYNFWPNHYHTAPVEGSTNFRLNLITSISTIYSLTEDNTDVYMLMYIKVAEGYSISGVAEEIQERAPGRRIENVEEIVTISKGSLRAAVIYGSLNSNFIASAAILILAMSLMMVMHSVDRSNEVGIMKATGISPSQLFGFFFTESFSVIAVGSFAGVFLGLLSSFMFMSVIAVNSFIPPWEMVYNPLKLISTIFVMLLISILSSAIPGIIFSRKKEAIMIKQL